MNRLKRTAQTEPAPWGVCLECGNRYQSAKHGYRVNWCSTRCEEAAIRRQRNEIETNWVRARWFLR
jgi:tRNA(Ile2) C34 agmatinyltransferase TiaS